MKTYEQAVLNQWVIAYHRIAFAKEEHRQCNCDDCKEHFEALKLGPTSNFGN